MEQSKRWSALFLLVGVVASACSSGATTTGPSASTATNPSASTSASAAASGNAGLAYVQKQVDKYSALPVFQAPGAAIDAAGAKGKAIFNVPASSTVPFCVQTEAQMNDLASSMGMTFESWKNQGDLSQWVQGLQQGVQKKASIINIFCGLDAARIVPQIQAAKQAGVKVVAAHTYAIGQEPQPDLAAIVYGAYTDAARAMADWVIAQTKGKANVLVITSPTTSNSPFMESAIKDEFAKYCPGCKAEFFGVNVADWPKAIQPKVQSTIAANADLNYVIPIYDGMVQFVVPGIIASNAGAKVKVASFNATPSVLDMIRTGDIVTFDIGEDTGWLAGAILDQDLRVLLGQTPIKNYAPGLRAFTKTNVAEAGVPAQVGKGYGDAAVLGYKKLWGLGGS